MQYCGGMATGLRERKRRQAMTRIQESALDLFDERGYSNVSVEEVAEAADISPSSVYRYFGTKEGIVLADELNFLSDEEIADRLNLDDPIAAVQKIVGQFEHVKATTEGADAGPNAQGTGREPGSQANRRIRYFFEEPAVRRASHEMLADAATRIAPLLAGKDGLTESEAYVAASALVFGYFAALERWYLGDTAPIDEMLAHALDALRKM